MIFKSFTQQGVSASFAVGLVLAGSSVADDAYGPAYSAHQQGAAVGLRIALE